MHSGPYTSAELLPSKSSQSNEPHMSVIRTYTTVRLCNVLYQLTPLYHYTSHRFNTLLSLVVSSNNGTTTSSAPAIQFLSSTATSESSP